MAEINQNANNWGLGGSDKGSHGWCLYLLYMKKVGNLNTDKIIESKGFAKLCS
jgi:hypothetical protein